MWIGSTSAMLMVLPVIIEHELADMAKSQVWLLLVACCSFKNLDHATTANATWSDDSKVEDCLLQLVAR